MEDLQGFIRATDLAKYLGMGMSTIWTKSKHEAGFPKPIKISSRITVWDKKQIDKWVHRNDPVTEVEITE